MKLTVRRRLLNGNVVNDISKLEFTAIAKSIYIVLLQS